MNSDVDKLAGAVAQAREALALDRGLISSFSTGEHPVHTIDVYRAALEALVEAVAPDDNHADDCLHCLDGEAYEHTYEPTRWVAGWNVPGYSPESDPAGFGSRYEAVAYLSDELERVLDGVAMSSETSEADDPRAFSYEEKVHELESDGWCLIPNTGGAHDLGVAYWVTEHEG